MMPLTLADIGEENTIRKIGGKPEVKKNRRGRRRSLGKEWRRVWEMCLGFCVFRLMICKRRAIVTAPVCGSPCMPLQ